MDHQELASISWHFMIWIKPFLKNSAATAAVAAASSLEDLKLQWSGLMFYIHLVNNWIQVISSHSNRFFSILSIQSTKRQLSRFVKWTFTLFCLIWRKYLTSSQWCFKYLYLWWCKCVKWRFYGEERRYF